MACGVLPELEPDVRAFIAAVERHRRSYRWGARSRAVLIAANVAIALVAIVAGAMRDDEAAWLMWAFAMLHATLARCYVLLSLRLRREMRALGCLSAFLRALLADDPQPRVSARRRLARRRLHGPR